MQYKQSDFFFRIPENDIGITCSKRTGAEFYVMFSKDSTQLSDSVDYIKFRTGESIIRLMFDPQNINDIYIEKPYYYFELEEIHPVNYNLQIDSEFDSLFFEPRIKGEPLVLKSPFIYVSIIPRTYDIKIEKHEFDFKWIKEGDIHGGW